MRDIRHTFHCCPQPENYQVIVSLCGKSMRKENAFAYPRKFVAANLEGTPTVRCEVCESHPDLPLHVLGDVP
jgi:hypothetical protein